MENQEYLRQLLEKYRDNRCSPSEVKQLLVYFRKDSQQQDELMELVLTSLKEDPVNEGIDENRIDSALDRAYLNIQEHIERSSKVKTRWLFWTKIATAAIITVTMGTFFLYYNNISKKVGDSPIVSASSIVAGGNKAILTLGNGRKIQLNNAANGVIATDAGSTITQTGGELNYNASGEGQNDTNKNTIQTPNGGQFQVRLPDGSLVLLNAGSTLTYPVSFASLKERRVELTGEAYFEVAHNKKMPFKVVSLGQTVEVLGTHFNINNYADEKGTVTTLEKGSVKVSSASSVKTIRPGEQTINRGQGIEVKEADLMTALAWKNGRFKFRDAGLPEIMRQVARWYDIKIQYGSKIPTDLYSASISRQSDLSQVLKIFESSQIKFKLIEDAQGKTLIIQ